MHDLDLGGALVVGQGEVTVGALGELDARLEKGLSSKVNHFLVKECGGGQEAILVEHVVQGHD